METAPLVVPTFDMAYLSLSSKSNFLLCCGGGGSANSGVLNQIQIVPVPSTGKTLGPLFSFGTDSKDEKQLCSGICCGIINNIPVVAVILSNKVAVFSVNECNEAPGIKLLELMRFAAHTKADVEISAICITPAGFIVAGGETGECFVWKCCIHEETNIWKEQLHQEVIAHKGSIACISAHPLNPIVCSTSRDGRCVIWEYVTGTVLTTLNAPEGLGFRGCSFSISGERLFVLQSPKKGNSFIVCYTLSITQNDKETVVELDGTHGQLIHKFPCSKLCLSDDGKYIAVGCGDGTVVVVSESLSVISSFQNHDFPVTGLAFGPSWLAKDKRVTAIIHSCSADYKLVTRNAGGFSFMKMLLIALLIAMMLVLIVMSVFMWSKSRNLLTHPEL